MPDQHAVLSASGAHRWLECTPSARLEELFKPTTSDYAEEGTVAHKVAEIAALYQTEQITQEQYNERLAVIKESKWCTGDMIDECWAYADLIREKWKRLKEETGDATVLIEARIDFGKWVPGGFGTADCLILADGKMEVVDFKYGKGKRVDAFRNPQMRMYTLGAYNTHGLVYDVEHITMTIFQPRISNGVTSDEITIKELLDWGENYVKPRAKLAYAGKGEFHPSAETCKFCRARSTCRARAEENMKAFDEGPDVFLLSIEEAGKILEKAGDIESWLGDLKKYVESSLLDGVKVPGWKLVEGRSVRKYADVGAVAQAMINAGYDPALLYKPQELITLTQLEKDFGKKNVAEILGDLIVKPAGAPTLAPESDRRPEYTPTDEVLKKFDEGE